MTAIAVPGQPAGPREPTPRWTHWSAWLGVIAVLGGGIMLGRATANLLAGPLRWQILVLGGILLPFAFLCRWRTLVKFTLFFIVFEALLRRYIVNDIAIFFIKDVLLGVVYVKTFGARLLRSERVLPKLPTNIPLAFLLAWSVFQIFNPALPSYTIGLLGLRLSFWYVPLMFLVAALFHTKEELLGFIRKYLALGAGIALLGFVQWRLGPGHFLNKTYLDFEAYYAIVDEQVVLRGAGTFASNAAFAEYLWFIVLLALAFARINADGYRLSDRQKLFLTLALAMGLVATGQAALVMLVFMALFFTWLVEVRSRRGRSRMVVVAAGVAVGTAAMAFVMPLAAGLLSRLLMFANPTLLVKRVVMHVLEPIPRAILDAPLGHGLGSQSQGMQYLVGAAQARRLYAVEGGYAKFAWELGVVGLVLVVALHLTLLLWSLNVRRNLLDPDLRAVAFSCVMAQAGVLLWMFLSNSLDHSTFAILYWSMTGIMAALPRLDERARAA